MGSSSPNWIYPRLQEKYDKGNSTEGNGHYVRLQTKKKIGTSTTVLSFKERKSVQSPLKITHKGVGKVKGRSLSPQGNQHQEPRHGSRPSRIGVW